MKSKKQALLQFLIVKLKNGNHFDSKIKKLEPCRLFRAYVGAGGFYIIYLQIFDGNPSVTLM